MKITRIGLAACIALTIFGCGGNQSSDTVAPVFLTVDITEGVADVDISVPFDVVIPAMNINSQAKSPSAVLSQQQDVVLSEWVVTPVRTDGGTVASPLWRNFYNVTVPAGGSANLRNYRIFPSDYFQIAPLNQLFPQNPGYDRETGLRNIRQRLQVEVFGKTIAGDRISLRFDVNVNFFYATP
jgi:hypothetical protein